MCPRWSYVPKIRGILFFTHKTGRRRGGPQTYCPVFKNKIFTGTGEGRRGESFFWEGQCGAIDPKRQPNSHRTHSISEYTDFPYTPLYCPVYPYISYTTTPHTCRGHHPHEFIFYRENCCKSTELLRSITTFRSIILFSQYRTPYTSC